MNKIESDSEKSQEQIKVQQNSIKIIGRKANYEKSPTKIEMKSADFDSGFHTE